MTSFMTQKRKHGDVGRSGGVIYTIMEWITVFIWCQLEIIQQ